MDAKRSLLAVSLSLAATLVLTGPAPPAVAEAPTPETPAAREAEPSPVEAAAVAADTASPETAPTEAVTGPPPALSPAATEAQRAVVDPETGRIVPEPPAVRGPRHLAGEMQLRTNTSHRGLVEEPAPLGSVKVDLRGRFLSLLTGSVGPGGELSVEHGPPPDRAPGDGGEDEGSGDEVP